MKLLHIDDNNQILEPFNFYFEMIKGIDYTPCNDPVKGFELIKKDNFDAVLLDLAMPIMSGFEIVDKLYQSGEIKNQNIIIYSASTHGLEVINKLKRKGIHSYISKPTAINEIIDHLEKSFGVLNVSTS